MKIALTFNLKRRNVEAEQEYDTAKHIDALVAALRKRHEVYPFEVSESRWFNALQALAPRLVFNIAEGANSRTREASFPTLFEHAYLPYTGSNAWTLTLTQDKHLTALYLQDKGLACRFPVGAVMHTLRDIGVPSVLVKPNYEGSSKGVTNASVGSIDEVAPYFRRLRKRFPDGILVQEFIPGRDITVPWLEGIGALSALTVEATRLSAVEPYNIYTYRQKSVRYDDMQHIVVDCPQALQLTELIAKHLDLRSYGRIDFRQDAAGNLWFLEANALPALDYEGAMTFAAQLHGYSYDAMLHHIVKHHTK